MPALFPQPCVSLHVCPPLCLWGKKDPDNTCACMSAFMTHFYLFTDVLLPDTDSPRGKRAALMVLISDMSQMVWLTRQKGGGKTNGGGVWEENRDGAGGRRKPYLLN